MNKRKRELARAIKPHGYKIVGTTSQNHWLLRNRKTGHEMTASMSPANVKNSIRATLRNIKLYGGGS